MYTIQIAPLIEIAPFHATYLLLIILLSSLKAESRSVLHSANFQSYPLSHHCTPFTPPPLILSGTCPVLVLELQAIRWKKNKRNGWKKKKDSNIHNNKTTFADCLDHSIASLWSYRLKTLRIYYYSSTSSSY